jgi:hypothetical protein
MARLADEFGYFVNSIKEMEVFNEFKHFLEMVDRLKEIMSLLDTPEQEATQE